METPDFLAGVTALQWLLADRQTHRPLQRVLLYNVYMFAHLVVLRAITSPTAHLC